MSNLVLALITNVHSGGENFDPYSPPCEFGPFGIIVNEFGECVNKTCPGDQFQARVNYDGGEDICCCN